MGCPVARNTKAYDGRPECQRCNTCMMCPIGARYSPDYTYKQLLASKKVVLHDRTLIRKLMVEEGKNTIAAATGVSEERPNEEVEYRAKLFVVASGYAWTPHLLLNSQSSRFPNGLANSSGLVGRYMTGHQFISANMEVNKKLYPGMNEPYPIISREYFRCQPDKPFVRHDIQIFETTSGRRPRLKSESGDVPVRRRSDAGLAIAFISRRGQSQDVLRQPSFAGQHLNVGSIESKPLRRSDAKD